MKHDVEGYTYAASVKGSHRQVIYAKSEMALKRSRAPPIAEEDNTKTVIAGMPAYLDIHPVSDYEPIGRTGTAWIDSHRECSSRRLAVVQAVYQTTASDIKKLAQLAHPHVTRPIALYSTGIDMYVVYEHLEMAVRDFTELDKLFQEGNLNVLNHYKAAQMCLRNSLRDYRCYLKLMLGMTMARSMLANRNSIVNVCFLSVL